MPKRPRYHFTLFSEPSEPAVWLIMDRKGYEAIGIMYSHDTAERVVNLLNEQYDHPVPRY